MTTCIPFSPNTRIVLRPFSRWLYNVILLVLIGTTPAYAGPVTSDSAPQVNIFKAIAALPPAQRVPAAQRIYKHNCRKMPAASAMGNLDSLSLLAQRIGDQPLTCAVYEMRADYYSVNYGFNSNSIYYYAQAVNCAQKNGLKLEEGIYLQKNALYYALFKHSTTACQYFLNAQDIFKKIGYANVPDIAVYLWQFGEFYYDIGEYDECKNYLTQALQYPIPNLRNKISITNTLGLICRNYGQYPQALSTFKQVLAMAVSGRDTVWAGIANGNIGSVYFMQKQYARALPYIQTDYQQSLKNGETHNAVIALLRLAHISLESNQLKKTDTQLTDAVVLLAHDKRPVLKYQADLYKLRALYYERINNLQQALVFTKKYEAAKDSLVKQDNIAAVDRVGLRWEKDKHLIQLNRLKDDARLATTQLAFIIAILIILLIAAIVIYRRKIVQAKKDKELLISQKTDIGHDLENATSALAVYTKKLKDKNEVIEQFRKKIDRLQTNVYDEDEIEQLNSLVQTHIMTDETWNEFKKLFNKVHSKFFYNLTGNFPRLSVTDVRLLSLIKLGLNNREMANMLGITVEGIKKAKQRLRKKMDLASDQDIETAIADF